jgi:hypothetical protein
MAVLAIVPQMFYDAAFSQTADELMKRGLLL